VPFIPPMLATRLEDPRRLADPRYIAEPKLDGQRAQVHVRGGRTAACYSRPGLDLLRHAGMAWLRDLAWPVESAIFDGEAVAGDGNEGIQAVFHERGRAGGTMAIILFDLLSLDGQSVMREPWTARRKRLEGALEGRVWRAAGPLHGRCARLVGHVGRHGRRGDRPEGSAFDLPPGRPVSRLAEAQAEAHPDGHGDRWISGASHLGGLGRGRDAGVLLHAPAHRG
jgi:bifunctional non-homologous end joining protein LigD